MKSNLQKKQITNIDKLFKNEKNNIQFYNLNSIISIGYCVNSKHGIQKMDNEYFKILLN